MSPGTSDETTPGVPFFGEMEDGLRREGDTVGLGPSPVTLLLQECQVNVVSVSGTYPRLSLPRNSGQSGTREVLSLLSVPDRGVLTPITNP